MGNAILNFQDVVYLLSKSYLPVFALNNAAVRKYSLQVGKI